MCQLFFISAGITTLLAGNVQLPDKPPVAPQNKANDFILNYEGRKIKTYEELTDAVGGYEQDRTREEFSRNAPRHPDDVSQPEWSIWLD